MDNSRDKRQRERNPITGDGMRDRDSQVNFRTHKPKQASNLLDTEDIADDRSSLMSEEESSQDIAALELDQSIEHLRDTHFDKETPNVLNLLTLQDVNTIPTKLDTQKVSSETITPLAVKVSRRQQQQRDRNPITGDGMTDRDYRATVPSFKIHGPQRKEGNPLNFEGYANDDRAYQSNVQEASISPLKRSDEKVNASVLDKQYESIVQASSDIASKPASRQRQRDRNPITGDGMEDRDFRVQIPTFKIHGPQRQSGDPLTGTGYESNDKEYKRKVQDASESPLNAPSSTAQGGNGRLH